MRPFGKALLLAVVGAGLVARGWPWSLAGAVALALGAAIAVRAAWRWERTRLLVTDGALVVVDGTLRRRAASVRLDAGNAVEIEQSLPCRLLGYGTVVAGELEIEYVPHPDELARLLAA